MWINSLKGDRAEAVLGEHWQEIRRRVLGLAGDKTLVQPEAMGLEQYRQSLRLGPNGPSVYLFLDSLKEVKWRSSEGRWHHDDSEVIRADLDYPNLLNPQASPRWEQAVVDAQGDLNDPHLGLCWEVAWGIGYSIGSHHAANLVACASCELLQIPSKDFHFFLDMMPWFRNGFWPCGWDDARGKLCVL